MARRPRAPRHKTLTGILGTLGLAVLAAVAYFTDWIADEAPMAPPATQTAPPTAPPTAATPVPAAPAATAPATAHPAGWTCGAKTTCGQMSSCEEATFHLTQCGVKRLDGDGDGVPCNRLCDR